MEWNQLDYDNQLKVISKINGLLALEIDVDIQAGLVAAINELKLWSNQPCLLLNEEEALIVSAKDSFEE